MRHHNPMVIKAVLRGLLLACVVCALLSMKLQTAQAAGTVSNCATYGPGPGTLQNALSGGGVITFSCSGTIIVPEIFIGQDTTLDGTGQTVILSGNNTNPVLNTSQLTVNIIHLSIMNGKYVTSSTHGSAGIYNQGGNLTITDSIIAQNTLTTNNYFQGLGGGLTTEGGTVTITGSQFYGNLTVNGEGGAIHNSNGIVSISNTTINNNQATSNNSIGGYGGGIANFDGQMTLDNVTINNNTARSGGGIANFFKSMTINNSTLSGNSVSGGGGAVMNFGILDINNSLIDGNTAIFWGGGVQNGIGNMVSLNVTGTTFSKNSVTGTKLLGMQGYGGAIFNYGSINVRTSTFSGNAAPVGGRAIWSQSPVSRATCSNIVGNSGAAPFSIQGISDVRNNWWGAVSGPSGGGPGTGDPVSGAANFSGFLAAPATNTDCPPPLVPPTPIPASSHIPAETASAVADCSDLNGISNPIVRAHLQPGIFDVHCRIIAENRHFIRTPAEVGNPAVLNSGVIHAVDVFSPSNEAAAGTQICLQGIGRIIFLDAFGAPRVPQSLATTTQDGYSCATIPHVGTVVLVDEPILSSPAAAQNEVVSDCQVTTTHQVNLRSEPNSTSKVITLLPYQLTLKATERANGFLKVIYLDGQGWVSSDYLTLQGSCGN